MKKALKIILNKYILAIVFVVVWVLFFDETNLFTQIERLDNLHRIEDKVTYYKNEITTARQELEDIKNNDESLEKFAREKYFMKKEGEDIFLIENPQK